MKLKLWPTYDPAYGGLGDFLAKWFESRGITSSSYVLWKKKYLPWLKNTALENISCGCEFRKNILNIIFPVFWKKFDSGTISFAVFMVLFLSGYWNILFALIFIVLVLRFADII